MARSVAWNYFGAIYEAIAGICAGRLRCAAHIGGGYGVLLLAMSLCSMMFMLDLGLSALRKNLTEPTVLLGFREGLFPGAADVWKRRDSPGANVHGAFRSIQAL
jgi:hypothetical protein